MHHSWYEWRNKGTASETFVERSWGRNYCIRARINRLTSQVPLTEINLEIETHTECRVAITKAISVDGVNMEMVYHQFDLNNYISSDNDLDLTYFVGYVIKMILNIKSLFSSEYCLYKLFTCYSYYFQPNEFVI